MGNIVENKEGDMLVVNLTTVLIGFVFLIVGVMLAIGKVQRIIEKIKKNKAGMLQKMKIKEMCLKAGELAMLDGLILLMKGFIVSFDDYMFAYAALAWAVVACFDIVYVTVTKNIMEEGDYR